MKTKTYKLIIKKNDTESIEKELTEEKILDLANHNSKYISEVAISLIENNKGVEDLICGINERIIPRLRHYLVDSFLDKINRFLSERGEEKLTRTEEDELEKIFIEEGYPQSDSEALDMIARAKERAKAKSKNRENSKDEEDNNYRKNIVVGPKQVGKPNLNR